MPVDRVSVVLAVHLAAFMVKCGVLLKSRRGGSLIDDDDFQGRRRESKRILGGLGRIVKREVGREVMNMVSIGTAASQSGGMQEYLFGYLDRAFAQNQG